MSGGLSYNGCHFRGGCINIFDCTFVPVEVRNIPAFLSECTLSITNYTNGLLFSSYATASCVIINVRYIDRVILLKTDTIFACHKRTRWKFRGYFHRKSLLELSISEFQRWSLIDESASLSWCWVPQLIPVLLTESMSVSKRFFCFWENLISL